MRPANSRTQITGIWDIDTVRYITLSSLLYRASSWYLTIALPVTYLPNPYPVQLRLGTFPRRSSTQSKGVELRRTCSSCPRLSVYFLDIGILLHVIRRTMSVSSDSVRLDSTMHDFQLNLSSGAVYARPDLHLSALAEATTRCIGLPEL